MSITSRRPPATVPWNALAMPATTLLSPDERRTRVALLACLLACGAFPLVMLAARTTVSDQLSYTFLVWNLFLAGIPVLLALAFETALRHRRELVAAIVGVGWLLFFPNSPYLMTDLIHLQERPPTPLWFDALILVSAAVAGLLAGFVSLHLVQSAVGVRWSRAWGWVVAVTVLGLSGFGVYLGRFARYNSWDVLTRPRSLLYDVGSSVGPSGGGRAVVVTALFSSFLLCSYATVRLLSGIGPSRSRT
jgi:uncharacterized membrane protein